MDYYGEIVVNNEFLAEKLSIIKETQKFKLTLEYSSDKGSHRERIIELSGKYKIKDKKFKLFVDCMSEDFIMDWVDEEPLYEAVFEDYEDNQIEIVYSIEIFNDNLIQLKLKEESRKYFEKLGIIKTNEENVLKTLSLQRINKS
ncbi:MAG: hypothetical protein ACXAC7_10395 [Candidatus Hodarchaeales archaeon]|jgi:hypothetical protein